MLKATPRRGVSMSQNGYTFFIGPCFASNTAKHILWGKSVELHLIEGP